MGNPALNAQTPNLVFGLCRCWYLSCKSRQTNIFTTLEFMVRGRGLGSRISGCSTGFIVVQVMFTVGKMHDAAALFGT